MSKQVTHIDCPAEWQSTNDWDSHRPLLYLTCEKTKGFAGYRLELGCGDGATNLLQKYYENRGWLDKDQNLNGETFLSFETNKMWASRFKNVSLVQNYFEYPILLANDARFVFIDCAPAEIRKELIDVFLKNGSEIIIAHDTEPGANYVYGMTEVLSTFKYRVDYCPEGKPWTTAVSNFVNIEEWV